MATTTAPRAAEAETKILSRRIAVEIGHHNGEADRATGGVQRIVVQRVGIGDAANASHGIIGIACDDQCSGSV